MSKLIARVVSSLLLAICLVCTVLPASASMPAGTYYVDLSSTTWVNSGSNHLCIWAQKGANGQRYCVEESTITSLGNNLYKFTTTSDTDTFYVKSADSNHNAYSNCEWEVTTLTSDNNTIKITGNPSNGDKTTGFTITKTDIWVVTKPTALYMIGSGTSAGWTQDTSSTTGVLVGKSTTNGFEFSNVPIDGQFRFWDGEGNWDKAHQYGNAETSTETKTVAVGTYDFRRTSDVSTSDRNFTISEGTYDIELNFKTGKMTIKVHEDEPTDTRTIPTTLKIDKDASDLTAHSAVADSNGKTFTWTNVRIPASGTDKGNIRFVDQDGKKYGPSNSGNNTNPNVDGTTNTGIYMDTNGYVYEVPYHAYNYDITVTFSDRDNFTVTFTQLEDPNPAVTIPKNLYLVGNLDNWNWNDTNKDKTVNSNCPKGEWDETEKTFTFSGVTLKDGWSSNGTNYLGFRFMTETNKHVDNDAANYSYGPGDSNVPITIGGDAKNMTFGKGSCWTIVGTEVKVNVIVDFSTTTPTVKVTEYKEPKTYPANLYIVGNLNGGDDWTNGKAAVPTLDESGKSTGIYTWIGIQFSGNKQFRFCNEVGKGSTQANCYGSGKDNGNGITAGANVDYTLTPNNMQIYVAPNTTDKYTIVVDLTGSTPKIVKFETYVPKFPAQTYYVQNDCSWFFKEENSTTPGIYANVDGTNIKCEPVNGTTNIYTFTTTKDASVISINRTKSDSDATALTNCSWKFSYTSGNKLVVPNKDGQDSQKTAIAVTDTYTPPVPTKKVIVYFVNGTTKKQMTKSDAAATADDETNPGAGTYGLADQVIPAKGTFYFEVKVDNDVTTYGPQADLSSWSTSEANEVYANSYKFLNDVDEEADINVTFTIPTTGDNYIADITDAEIVGPTRLFIYADKMQVGEKQTGWVKSKDATYEGVKKGNTFTFNYVQLRRYSDSNQHSYFRFFSDGASITSDKDGKGDDYIYHYGAGSGDDIAVTLGVRAYGGYRKGTKSENFKAFALDNAGTNKTYKIQVEFTSDTEFNVLVNEVNEIKAKDWYYSGDINDWKTLPTWKFVPSTDSEYPWEDEGNADDQHWYMLTPPNASLNNGKAFLAGQFKIKSWGSADNGVDGQNWDGANGNYGFWYEDATLGHIVNDNNERLVWEKNGSKLTTIDNNTINPASKYFENDVETNVVNTSISKDGGINMHFEDSMIENAKMFFTEDYNGTGKPAVVVTGEGRSFYYFYYSDYDMTTAPTAKLFAQDEGGASWPVNRFYKIYGEPKSTGSDTYTTNVKPTAGQEVPNSNFVFSKMTLAQLRVADPYYAKLIDQKNEVRDASHQITEIWAAPIPKGLEAVQGYTFVYNVTNLVNGEGTTTTKDAQALGLSSNGDFFFEGLASQRLRVKFIHEYEKKWHPTTSKQRAEARVQNDEDNAQVYYRIFGIQNQKLTIKSKGWVNDDYNTNGFAEDTHANRTPELVIEKDNNNLAGGWIKLQTTSTKHTFTGPEETEAQNARSIMRVNADWGEVETQEFGANSGTSFGDNYTYDHGSDAPEGHQYEFNIPQANANDYIQFRIERKVNNVFGTNYSGDPTYVNYIPHSGIYDPSIDNVWNEEKGEVKEPLSGLFANGAYKLNGSDQLFEIRAASDDGIAVNVEEIFYDEDLFEEGDVETVWYNLQGVRVVNPGHGLYIRVRGNKSDKVLL